MIAAALNGHSQVVQALVAAGAQLDFRSNKVGFFSSLVCSSVGGLLFLEFFFLSLSRWCASVCQCHCLSVCVCVRFACPPVPLSACFVCGVLDVFRSRGLALQNSTALILAAAHGRKEVVAVLIDGKADVNANDEVCPSVCYTVAFSVSGF